MPGLVGRTKAVTAWNESSRPIVFQRGGLEQVAFGEELVGHSALDGLPARIDDLDHCRDAGTQEDFDTGLLVGLDDDRLRRKRNALTGAFEPVPSWRDQRGARLVILDAEPFVVTRFASENQRRTRP